MRSTRGILGRGPGTTAPPKIVVYAPFEATRGPLLSLGVLVAHARSWRGGALTDSYELRPPQDAVRVLEDVAEAGPQPAVMLLSDYVWSLSDNLALARRARAVNPFLVFIHGGPSSPKYDVDARRFLEDHGDVADVLVRGEGEVTLAEVLSVLTSRFATDGVNASTQGLEQVAGITFRSSASGEIIRTADRDRMATLDVIPSPFLSGLFDQVDATAWPLVTFESNRGCPYGCTFCDWGSATLSRLRMFDVDRVEAEMRWAAEHGLHTWMIADANFGILSRDVDLIERVVRIKRATGLPQGLALHMAKNTTRHLVRILDLLTAADIRASAALSLQSQDPDTLAAIHRQNIAPQQYTELAAALRVRGLPLLGDLMLGLPGQTPEAYRRDLQFLLDREITARTWPTQLVQNAPMNEPGYRDEHRVVTDEHRLVVSTASFTTQDRERMLQLRLAHAAFEHFGMLRHLARYVQWDHDLDASLLYLRIVEHVPNVPEDFPLLAWVLRYFDVDPIPPLGWHSFYDEVRRFIEEVLGIVPCSALDTVIDVQLALMPAPGREFPRTVGLAHDYVAYHRDATATLWTTGEPGLPSRPLADWPPGDLPVLSDPLGLCGSSRGLPRWERRFDEISSFWINDTWELNSPLARTLTHQIREPGAYDAVDDGQRGRWRAPKPVVGGVVASATPVQLSNTTG